MATELDTWVNFRFLETTFTHVLKNSRQWMAKNNHTLIGSAMKLTTYLVDSLERLITVIAKSSAVLSIIIVSYRFFKVKN